MAQGIKVKMVQLRDALATADERAKKAEAEFFSLKQKSDEANEEVNRLQKEVDTVEDEISTSEKMLSEMTGRLMQTEKEADESERQRKTLEERGHEEFDRLSRINTELGEILGKNDEIELRYEQIANEIQVLEKNLDVEEQQCNSADVQARTLEKEVFQVVNNAQSLGIIEEMTAEQEEVYNEKIREMTLRFNESQELALKYEEHARELETTLAQLDGRLDGEKDMYGHVKNDLDNLLLEIQVLND